MNLHGYRYLILFNNIFLFGAVPSLHTETYNGYTVIMPFTDDSARSQLQSNYSLAENWCSAFGATLPRIVNETDQKNIAGFIRSAAKMYNFDSVQTIFVNHISDWIWVNGHKNKGFKVKQVSTINGEGIYFGYLWTNNYGISASLPLQPMKYICEKSALLSNSSQCELKLGNRCYWKKSDELFTWYKARSACLNEGGDLASFDIYTENVLNVVLKNLNLNTGTRYWVGIYKGVWQCNDTNIDSEINCSNRGTGHPSNYDAKCECLHIEPYDYKLVDCDCNKEYPVICKRYDTSDSDTATSASKLLNVDFAETSTLNQIPNGQLPSTSVISETVRFALVLSSCVIIVVGIILAVTAFMIWKQRNRVNSSSTDTSQADTSAAAEVFQIYAQVQKPRGNDQSARNCSESSTTYATVQPTRKTNNRSPTAQHIVYAELDLQPKA